MMHFISWYKNLKSEFEADLISDVVVDHGPFLDIFDSSRHSRFLHSLGEGAPHVRVPCQTAVQQTGVVQVNIEESLFVHHFISGGAHGSNKVFGGGILSRQSNFF